MNVASLDLCKKLFELSGWEDCFFYWNNHILRTKPKVYKKWGPAPRYNNSAQALETIPAYDLGYLLRKLPEGSHLIKAYSLGTNKTSYNISLKTERPLPVKMFLLDADTPEDAACKLAIELWKQNILKKEK